MYDKRNHWYSVGVFQEYQNKIKYDFLLKFKHLGIQNCCRFVSIQQHALYTGAGSVINMNPLSLCEVLIMDQSRSYESYHYFVALRWLIGFTSPWVEIW